MTATVMREAGLAAPERSGGASPRALSVTEKQQVLDVLHTDRFVDRASAEVYATLLDDGTFPCSLRTMCRVLASATEVRGQHQTRVRGVSKSLTGFALLRISVSHA